MRSNPCSPVSHSFVKWFTILPLTPARMKRLFFENYTAAQHRAFSRQAGEKWHECLQSVLDSLASIFFLMRGIRGVSVAEGKLKIVLNMKEIEYIDSAGLGMLVAAHLSTKTHEQQQGASQALLGGIKEPIHQVLFGPDVPCQHMGYEHIRERACSVRSASPPPYQ